MDTKDKIIKLLKSTDRDNIEDLIDYMLENDFFKQPASKDHHSNYEGGLADHSLLVFKNFKSLEEKHFSGSIPIDSIIISSLLHDICKIDRYERKVEGDNITDSQVSYLKTLIQRSNMDVLEKVGKKVKDLTKQQATDLIGWLKDSPEDDMPKIDDSIVWDYSDDEFPFGHGEKSVIIIQDCGVGLKEREKLAIRWHMGAWTKGIKTSSLTRKLNSARDMYPDVELLFIADKLASFKEDWCSEVGDKNEEVS